MNAIDFLKTVYFGDRYCTKLSLDSTNNQVELHINQISRIRDKSGEWNYYLDEDIENGVLVFTGIKEVFLDKSGLMPNDQIYDVHANEQNGIYEFVIETSHVDVSALTHDLTIRIIGEGVYLLDPTKPDVRIQD